MKRVALITGGSRGIGFGIAMQLAINGFDIAINGTRAPRCQDAVKKLKDLGNDVIYCQGNISSVADREHIIDEVRKHYGALHVLVNNAGIAPKVRSDILEATEESFDDVVSVNLKGTYFLTQKQPSG
jgi:NAD(P)-dependent dehydrogenase (short-subunit alcohol dehydrogenase family)